MYITRPPAVVGEDNVKLALSSYLNPVLYISSIDDPIGSTKYALWYEKNSNNGTLFIFPGKGHGVVLLKKYSGYILQFLKSLD
ncbi:MAG: alpha/beta hydrolase [Persephonella sp.]|nr:alpha/beta hydrolase [Persephonella sp.]